MGPVLLHAVGMNECQQNIYAVLSNRQCFLHYSDKTTVASVCVVCWHCSYKDQHKSVLFALVKSITMSDI